MIWTHHSPSPNRNKGMTILIPIFADQLSESLPPLNIISQQEAQILMVEVKGEADHLPHHRQKLVFLFSAMRHFAEVLREAGWSVDYIELTDSKNSQSFTGEVERAMSRHQITSILACQPGNYRVQETVRSWEEMFDLPVTIMPDDRFMSSLDMFYAWAAGRKQLRMEYFYREMRKKIWDFDGG